ncbi:class I SAM-dependent methyltransferase [Corynebacterium bouchesdurhonense]|uniref:class I SAM-dependent methyltransferase n=1 Tax=Corynebacterium bouchesdurhonense TaxID=1720192 RepID=UPI000837829F|nr:methyltransferase [Corynebacterium bouchesdurhonense]
MVRIQEHHRPTRAALAAGGPVVFLDPDYARSRAAAALGAEVAGDVRLDEYLAAASGSAIAVGEMPKSLARLDYLARSIAGAGYADVRVVLGGNNKHLSRGMNAVLGESFEDVAASLGRGKFRCLVASGPREVSYEPAQGDGLVGVGGVFSGAKPDRGGELLRSCLPPAPELGRFLDLGCGNGSVSRGLVAGGAALVAATDSDADAVLSARAIGLDATWDDAGSHLPDASFDTIALNPPFHDGTAVDATLVQHLLDASARLLAPGGELYLVHNSHLRYRGEVERRFSSVQQVERDKTFTVLRARL